MIYIFSWFLSVSKLETGLEWFKSSSLKNRPATMAVRSPKRYWLEHGSMRRRGGFQKRDKGFAPLSTAFKKS
jgi:hypothetical protein